MIMTAHIQYPQIETNTSIDWDRSGDSIVIRTNSESETVAIRIGGGLAGTNETQEIMAEHTSIDWDRSGDNIVIRTNSESETVAIRIGGGLAGTNETQGVTLENGTVTLSGEFANRVLEDGENTLRLIFSDGEIEISIFVTDTEKEREPSDTSESQNSDNTGISNDTSKPDNKDTSYDASKPDNTDTSDDTRKADNTNVPLTGDAYPIVIMLVIVASGCIIAFAAKNHTQKR